MLIIHLYRDRINVSISIVHCDFCMCLCINKIQYLWALEACVIAKVALRLDKIGKKDEFSKM